MTSRKRRPGSRIPLNDYTERALDEARHTIPRIVYLPRRLRGHNQMMTLDNLQVKISGHEIVDNHARIQEADPLGFMIAKMHGLPIPRFEIRCGAGGCPDPVNCSAVSHESFPHTVKVRYHTPSVKEQEDAAKWLGMRVTFRVPEAYHTGRGTAGPPRDHPTHAHDYDAMILNAASRDRPDTTPA